MKPGAFAAFVTSHGTMDKADRSACAHISRVADLVAAIRLPEGSFRSDAGTEVVVDIMFFRKRKPGEADGDLSWFDTTEIRSATEEEGAIRVNAWFARHPEMVLGTHTLTSGRFGETYTCLPDPDRPLGSALQAAIERLPEAIYDGEPGMVDHDLEMDLISSAVDRPREQSHVREGSYFVDVRRDLTQIIDGEPVAMKARKARGADGIPEKHIRIINKLIPVRDAVRDILSAQETARPWKSAQVRLRIAWSAFVREFGPINHTTVSITEDTDTVEVPETHRRPNIQPFLDDPDCWLVASIETYDTDTDTAKPGPIFDQRAGPARDHVRR